MSGRLQPGDELEQRRTARWAALMGLAGMLGFGTLLVGLGVVVYRASSRTNEMETVVAGVEARVEKLEGSQAGLARDVAAVRKGLESTTAAGELASLRARVAELTSSVSALREKAEGAGTQAAQERQDAAVGELREKLVSLGARVDRLSTGPAVEIERARGPVAEATRPVGISSDEFERELRDMREVINRYREESRMAPAVRLPGSPR
ncbi:MAG: hypothetical protein QM783_00675 [Phycisphaerales bacterium]